MPLIGRICLAALALATFKVVALPAETKAVNLRQPAAIETSLAIRHAKQWDGATTLERRDDPRARLAAFTQGQAIALSGLVGGLCATSLINEVWGLPACLISLGLLALNAVFQTIGMVGTLLGGGGGRGGGKRAADGAGNGIVWYYGHTPEASFKQQIQSDFDQGDGTPVPVGHMPCTDGTVCRKAWYSYSPKTSNTTSQHRHRMHITPSNHRWANSGSGGGGGSSSSSSSSSTSISSTLTTTALHARSTTVHGIGADGTEAAGNDLLYGGWIWEDADLATEEALAKENANDAAKNILQQMNDQYEINGFFGNTGVYCMGLKASATSDLANTGYLWYYQKLDYYQYHKEQQYMDQCKHV